MKKYVKFILFFGLSLLISQLTFISSFAEEAETQFQENTEGNNTERLQAILSTILKPDEFTLDQRTAVINDQNKTETLVRLNENLSESRADLVREVIESKFNSNTDHQNKVILQYTPKAPVQAELPGGTLFFLSLCAFSALLPLGLWFHRRKNHSVSKASVAPIPASMINTVNLNSKIQKPLYEKEFDLIQSTPKKEVPQNKTASLPIHQSKTNAVNKARTITKTSTSSIDEEIASNIILAKNYLKSLTPEREEALFKQLDEKYPKEAAVLRENEVYFKDIPNYPPQVVTQALDTISEAELVIALSDHTPEFTISFLAFLPIKKLLSVHQKLNRLNQKPTAAETALARRNITQSFQGFIVKND